MGSLHEFAAAYHISLGKARRMEKAGWLRIDSNATPADEIRIALRKGARLTVAQLAYLVETPSALLELGNYMRQASEQVDRLGDVKADVAPAEITAQMLDAYRNDSEAVSIVAAWVASVLPAEPVGHAWVATRLLLGVPESLRKQDIPRLQRVLMNCRNHDALRPHWFTVQESSRNVTYYQKRTLDL